MESAALGKIDEAGRQALDRLQGFVPLSVKARD